MRIATVVLFLMAGCVNPMDSFDLSREHIPFTPPAYYETWYAEVVADVGYTRLPFSAIRWTAVAPSGNLHEWYSSNHGYSTCGIYIERQIFLCLVRMADENLVKHELLHAISGRDDHGHPLFAEYRKIGRIEHLPDWAKIRLGFPIQ